MGSTYVCNYLPPATTVSISRLIDLGLLDTSNIISKPDRRETALVQQFIREYIDSKKSN